MIQNTRLAKSVYWLSGKTSKIKAYKQTYRLANEDEWMAAEGNMEMMFEPNGRRWGSISLTWKLLDLAVSLDHKHFDHWGLDHNRCNASLCDECGGFICSGEDEDNG